MPIDTIKTRYTMAAAGTPLRAVVREIMKEGGPVGFYRGFVPTMLRAFPANGARPTPMAMSGSGAFLLGLLLQKRRVLRGFGCAGAAFFCIASCDKHVFGVG